ncbi:MAG: HNH endonuclease [Rhodanobacter sp.]
MNEVWKPIPGASDMYEVSNLGHVRSFKVPGSRFGRRAETPRELGFACGKYLGVMLEIDGKYSLYYIHDLVMRTFVGPRPSGLEVCHNNGNSHDNRATNLRYGTAKENGLDRIKHGRSNRGETHGNSKLTADQVRDIRRLREEGHKAIRIAERFGISASTVTQLCRGTRWAWLV